MILCQNAPAGQAKPAVGIVDGHENWPWEVVDGHGKTCLAAKSCSQPLKEAIEAERVYSAPPHS